MFWAVSLVVVGVVLALSVEWDLIRVRRFALKFLVVFWFATAGMFAQELLYTPLTVMFLMLGITALEAWKMDVKDARPNCSGG